MLAPSLPLWLCLLAPSRKKLLLLLLLKPLLPLLLLKPLLLLLPTLLLLLLKVLPLLLKAPLLLLKLPSNWHCLWQLDCPANRRAGGRKSIRFFIFRLVLETLSFLLLWTI